MLIILLTGQLAYKLIIYNILCTNYNLIIAILIIMADILDKSLSYFHEI
jgi:hypothetical protein